MNVLSQFSERAQASYRQGDKWVQVPEIHPGDLGPRDGPYPNKSGRTYQGK